MATKASTPLLATMSKAARIAWPFIERAVSEGLGAQEIIEAMKGEGIPTFRRQDMLALIREASGAELLKSDIARWPKESVLPFNRVRQSVTKIVAPFSYTLRVTMVDADTGETTTVLRQAHSNQLRPFRDVIGAFLQAHEVPSDSVPLEIEDAEVVDVIQAGSAGSL